MSLTIATCRKEGRFMKGSGFNNAGSWSEKVDLISRKRQVTGRTPTKNQYNPKSPEKLEIIHQPLYKTNRNSQIADTKAHVWKKT